MSFMKEYGNSSLPWKSNPCHKVQVQFGLNNLTVQFGSLWSADHVGMVRFGSFSPKTGFKFGVFGFGSIPISIQLYVCVVP